ncbi:MAG: hypothetical protein ACREU7_12490 [Burkholderiales bacterium]
MKLTSKDIAPLRIPLAALVVAVALGWAIISYTKRDLDETQGRLATWTGALQEARDRFQRSDEEKATILKYLPDYTALQQQGFVGTERRLEWVEALRAADRKAGLHGVQYKIEPQESSAHPAVGGTIAQRLRRSTMRLTLGITHEADLLEFMDALREQGVGVFSVRSCAVSPVQSGQPEPGKANLNAECEIDWLSVAAREEPRT